MGNSGFGPAETGPGKRAGGIVNVLAALVSLVLLAGAAWWGFRLAVRDVSGVPVVRALTGPMREAPANPGGDFAANQGLSVNRIAADGSAAPPADELILAPRPVDLDGGDAPSAAGETAPTAVPLVAAGPTAPVAEKDAIADAVAAALQDSGAALDDTDETAAPDPEIAPEAEPETFADGAPAQSPRPMPRPGSAPMLTAAAASPAIDAPETDGLALASGTRLVQLGAFDSPELARAEWARLAGRFGDLLQGKARIVQAAKSGGRDFWRLRAQGFADESDQRRFCAALSAENAACIAVTVR